MLRQRFYQLDPNSVTDMADELRRLIKSYNVTVLFSCISVLHDFILADPSSFRDLVPFFSELLIKIVTGQFDPAYDFDTLPAPWVQMKVIRVSGAVRIGRRFWEPWARMTRPRRKRCMWRLRTRCVERIACSLTTCRALFPRTVCTRLFISTRTKICWKRPLR